MDYAENTLYKFFEYQKTKMKKKAYI